jgi:ribonucleoside-diphosphate reductase alpha chain
MRVIKRSGEAEDVSFDKVLQRLKNLCSIPHKPSLSVDVYDITQKVCARIFNNVSTSDLDELAAQICSSMIVNHPDYGELASRIIVSNHHKNTSPSFSETITVLYKNTDGDGEPCPLVSDEVYDAVMKNKEKLNSYLDYSRDYDFDFFGFKTLERAYLMKVKGRVIERPQHMFMRVAIGVHGGDIKDALQMYDLMSKKYYIHATPTLFNSGTKRPQLSSCFLLASEDSIEGIYDTLKECANISKYAGGIGMHIHGIRAKGSKIRGTNGNSTGVIPMLRVFNNTARYVNQSGKRNGSIAVYIEPWHADIESFLELRKPHGAEEERTRDLFLALWIPDLFMKRVQENGVWSLMCPDTCRGLTEVYGEEFEKMYTAYEAEGRYTKQVPAQKLWFKMLESQIEAGQPYMLYKDACNAKSNQKNLGTIKSSNLCVAPETPILTTQGYVPIKDLHGQQVDVWNGHEFSRTVVHQTGRMQKLLTVGFSNGMELRCTPYHKFFIEEGARPSARSVTREVEAQNLQVGMKIVRHALPTITSFTQTMKYPYTHGLFCAEGTYCTSPKETQRQCSYKKWNETDFCKRHQHYTQAYTDTDRCNAQCGEEIPLIRLYDKKKPLLQHIDSVYFSTDSSSIITVGLHHDIEKKFFVPINYSIDTKVQWLAGVADGDGVVIEYNGIKNIQIASVNKKFLQDIVLMLQTMGVSSKVTLAQPQRTTNIKGTMYECKDLYRIGIDSTSICHLQDLGFAPKRLDISGCKLPHHLTNAFITVTKVEDNDEYDDTFCFNEPKRHAGMFNGVLTSQCTEIVEYTDKDETAVCNLASIALPTFVKQSPEGTPEFDYDKLHEVTKVVTKNLNKVIDVNFYPVEKARRSNLRHRPIGIGIQGLADLFVLMKMPFDSVEASALNKNVFETIYHASLEASMEISKRRHEMVMELREGVDERRQKEIKEYLHINEFDERIVLDRESQYPGAYTSFAGSPASQGILQFDMWNVTPSTRYDWNTLKNDIKTYGLRNSLLLAPMPTASTSQILGFNECIEPFTSNLYKRKTLAGEFIVINKYLINELINLNVWSKEMKDTIILNDGSIQGIPSIPEHIQKLFKTVWEIKQKVIIDMAADRAAFVCQSQSMNLFMEDPDFKKLSSMHFYAWSKGLKTGMYYLRSKPKAQAQKFTIDPTLNKLTNLRQESKKTVVCTDEVCTVCSA